MPALANIQHLCPRRQSRVVQAIPSSSHKTTFHQTTPHATASASEISKKVLSNMMTSSWARSIRHLTIGWLGKLHPKRIQRADKSAKSAAGRGCRAQKIPCNSCVDLEITRLKGSHNYVQSCQLPSSSDTLNLRGHFSTVFRRARPRFPTPGRMFHVPTAHANGKYRVSWPWAACLSLIPSWPSEFSVIRANVSPNGKDRI